ncbi:ParB/RepB/Spo0J family partition protein [Sphaerotilus uruguayifluvii]|uniref:ParB family chromosome partitioning protein n=1 Tax=Sphaerotilus uruguayifluvii TaxID=2735897 RepID=A0ABX2G990_9BURK|nr:ParB/RepB/Spo0J family partition protein [Leptothrix sp. C29]NRT58014.1 ParB family chromosome partitioning protein [Leptothrix sp. C29]
MAKKIFEKAGLINLPNKPAVAASDVPDSPAQDPRPKTAPGAMLQFMGQQSAAVREVEELRTRLQEFDGAQVVRMLEPARVAPSRWANRHETSFADAEFALLKDEIRSAGGNVQPIKVRPLKPGQVLNGSTPGAVADFELIYGHRRHRACLELGLKVAALIEPMSDQELFQQMDRENRSRKNLSPWEQGCMYRKALDEGLYPSLRKLAEAVGVDVGQASRSVALTRLPAEIIQAFPSPNEIQYRWVKELADAAQRDPAGMLAASREIAMSPMAVSSKAIFEQLISERNQPAKSVEPFNTPAEPAQAASVDLVVSGKVLGQMRYRKSGGVSIDLDNVTLDEEQKTELLCRLEDVLREVLKW